ncbi:MAG: hypothetical protein M1828_003526 [Chrysothrix sp. TS-e1954]|nr:MAG: hypothetical protein M1828_003526 [Chrysothrix sp. TS-e1954]
MANVPQQPSLDKEGDFATAHEPRPESTVEPNVNGPAAPQLEHEEFRRGNKSQEEESKHRQKKRRKVNHGHLCHDEPHETARKSKSDVEISSPQGSSLLSQDTGNVSLTGGPNTNLARIADPGVTAGGSSVDLPQTANASTSVNEDLEPKDWPDGTQNAFSDMHQLHPNYMFHSSEVSNEYNLLSDFLSDSLQDGAFVQGEDPPNISATSFNNCMDPFFTPNNLFPPSSFQTTNAPPQMEPQDGNRSNASGVIDKAKETYYMTAADPAGTDTPENRLDLQFKAKYDAGLLKPFDYVSGYARLETWMKQNLRPESRETIQRQFNSFRPKFRQRIQKLSDLELVQVEVWFERQLCIYDRAFASMAIPACCWRRTGEIFRGNREMAELLHMPMEKLRGGSIALHQIFTEESLVSYWEKFTTIAFEGNQKGMLTNCTLKMPDRSASETEVRCCFSFTIARDQHQVPALIVGNFLPMKLTESETSSVMAR